MFSRLAAAETAAGRCGDAYTTVKAARVARASDGNLQHVWVRLASTCNAVPAAERAEALRVAEALYKQLPTGAHAEALALALAANGKAKDAVGYQQQMLFEAARQNDQVAAARGQTFMKLFEAGRGATQPWPVGHPLYAPPRLVPSVRPK